MARALLRISEIAKLLGISAKTIRHYHKLGLVPEPIRSESGYRLYATKELLQLRRIRRLQSLGFSLQEIKFILESANPDELLQESLKNLEAELAQEKARIEARQQRIADYLAEGVSIVEIEQSESTKTYESLMKKFPNLPEMRENLKNFDEQIFAQWDDFDWGADYGSLIDSTAQFFESQNENSAIFLQLMERMNALQNMKGDEAEIEQWAEEFKASGLSTILANYQAENAEMNPAFSEVMRNLFMQSADEHLVPAQIRFLEFLIS